MHSIRRCRAVFRQQMCRRLSLCLASVSRLFSARCRMKIKRQITSHKIVYGTVQGMMSKSPRPIYERWHSPQIQRNIRARVCVQRVVFRHASIVVRDIDGCPLSMHGSLRSSFARKAVARRSRLGQHGARELSSRVDTEPVVYWSARRLARATRNDTRRTLFQSTSPPVLRRRRQRAEQMMRLFRCRLRSFRRQSSPPPLLGIVTASSNALNTWRLQSKLSRIHARRPTAGRLLRGDRGGVSEWQTNWTTVSVVAC